MKKLLFVLSLVLVSITASAQITWNVKVGGGISTIFTEEEGIGAKFGWKVGVGIEKPIAANWLIMPTLEFKQKGASLDFENSRGDNSILHAYYIQLPVMAAFRTSLSDEVNLTLKAGPYFAYGISGNNKYEVDGYEYELDLFGDEEDSYAGKRFEVGAMVGADVEYHRFVFGVEAEYAFTNLFPDFMYTYNNFGAYVTVGYKF